MSQKGNYKVALTTSQQEAVILAMPGYHCLCTWQKDSSMWHAGIFDYRRNENNPKEILAVGVTKAEAIDNLYKIVVK